MSQLIDLITNLKAFTIVFIENAFVYETNPEKILGKFCFLPTKNQAKLVEGLTVLNNPELGETLHTFYRDFIACERNREAEANMPASEYFVRYLTEINAAINQEAVIEQIAAVIEADGDNLVKDLFLKYGIYSSVDEAGYEDLIKEIGGSEILTILIYKAQPPDGDVDNFFKDIEDAKANTGSEFCLAIIDKKLATGAAENEGRSFIKDHIVPRNERDQTKIICCLYTSQPDGDLPLETFADYFIQEIGKSDDEKYERITKTLARSAYAQVFYTLNNQYKNSSENALSMVLKNQKNIKYIVEHSHREGIPGFEAVKHWFNLAQQYQLEQEEIKASKFIAGIVRFFNHQHLDDHPHIGVIGPELRELNSFELFDNNVNKKFLPIAPGDIFQKENDYFVLVGQLCDLMLRSANERNAKLGELLKIELVDIPNTTEKYSIETILKRKVITIQNFPIAGAYKSIAIDISTDTTEYGDLTALDLVMFNSDGVANIVLEKGSDIEANKLLPENFIEYYSNIQDKFTNLTRILNMDGVDLSHVTNNNIKFSILKFVVNDQVVDLGFKRVARLKGRYYDSLYNNFLNNKGRIDLNLIDNSPEHASVVKLIVHFLPDNNPSYEINDANVWLASGEEHFKTAELIAVLPPAFKPMLQRFDPLIKVEASNQYEISKDDDGTYSLGLKYLITDKLYQAKAHYSYKALFNEEKPKNNPLFKVEGEDNASFLNDEGRASVALTIDQLKRGVIVYEKKTKTAIC